MHHEDDSVNPGDQLQPFRGLHRSLHQQLDRSGSAGSEIYEYGRSRRKIVTSLVGGIHFVSYYFVRHCVLAKAKSTDCRIRCRAIGARDYFDYKLVAGGSWHMCLCVHARHGWLTKLLEGLRLEPPERYWVRIQLLASSKVGTREWNAFQYIGGLHRTRSLRHWTVASFCE